jgi:hypothetical protein
MRATAVSKFGEARGIAAVIAAGAGAGMRYREGFMQSRWSARGMNVSTAGLAVWLRQGAATLYRLPDRRVHLPARRH